MLPEIPRKLFDMGGGIAIGEGTPLLQLGVVSRNCSMANCIGLLLDICSDILRFKLFVN
jgi:hypothetical protein